MNELVKEWVDKSEKDFATAIRENKVTEFPNYDAVCYHSQQCIEKLMKALILKHQGSFEYTHNLISLQNILITLNPIFIFEINHLKFLTRAAIDFRYPGENADMEEAEEAIAICDSLRSKLKEFIGNEYFTYPINFPA